MTYSCLLFFRNSISFPKLFLAGRHTWAGHETIRSCISIGGVDSLHLVLYSCWWHNTSCIRIYRQQEVSSEVESIAQHQYTTPRSPPPIVERTNSCLCNGCLTMMLRKQELAIAKEQLVFPVFDTQWCGFIILCYSYTDFKSLKHLTCMMGSHNTAAWRSGSAELP